MKEYKITANAKEFMFGGNSYFTIKNEVSGKCGKYHIKKKGETYFVSVKDGNSYVYAGFIRKNSDGTFIYARGKAGAYEVGTTEIKGLLWMIRHTDNMDARVSLIHHGKCACCGRALDDEESIRRGFGPYCYKRILGL